jgi:hypothetical protein
MPRETANIKPLSNHEQGAAFLAWYRETMQMDGFNAGMITRAQAARVLGVTNLGVGRLIGRGHIRARYFPREPSVELVPVGADDPFWMRLVQAVSQIGKDADRIEWYEACYVSLEDVVALWEKNDQREKARFNWRKLIDAEAKLPAGPHARSAAMEGDERSAADGSGANYVAAA